MAQFLTQVSQFVALAVGVSYVLGFLSVSLDLGSYGLAPVGLAKADYLAVGFFEFGFLATATAFGFFLLAATLAPLFVVLPAWILFIRRRNPPELINNTLGPHPLLSPPYSTLFLGSSLLLLSIWTASSYWLSSDTPTGSTDGLWKALVVGAIGGGLLLLVGSLAWDPMRHPEEPQSWFVVWPLRGGMGCAWVAPMVAFVIVNQAAHSLSAFELFISALSVLAGCLLFMLAWFSRLPNRDRFLWLRVGVLALVFVASAFLLYVVYVYPWVNRPFGGRKPFVKVLVDIPVDPGSSKITVESTKEGTWVGPAYVVLEKPDAIVLSAYPWLCPKIRPQIYAGTLLAYIELPKSNIRGRQAVTRSTKDGHSACP
ncbi:MAG: hypothetical protein PHP75_04585 [Methylacidiphilaceae bacterium]|nr:hypothetical protein [Candidatus Methylacidiphilaceae bacterium]